MKVIEGRLGRVFVLRLDDGDIVPDCVERFATQENVKVAQIVLLGAVKAGEVVAGPRDAHTMPVNPMLLPVDGVHELIGVGLLAPDEEGSPRLHVHGALGRAGTTLTGCLRPGVDTWNLMEVVVTEILNEGVRRVHDDVSGFSVLSFEG